LKDVYSPACFDVYSGKNYSLLVSLGESSDLLGQKLYGWSIVQMAGFSKPAVS
jgi:hypothetical protein